MARGFKSDTNKSFTARVTEKKKASRALMEKYGSKDKIAHENFIRPAYYGTIAQVNGGECYYESKTEIRTEYAEIE